MDEWTFAKWHKYYGYLWEKRLALELTRKYRTRNTAGNHEVSIFIVQRGWH